MAKSNLFKIKKHTKLGKLQIKKENGERQERERERERQNMEAVETAELPKKCTFYWFVYVYM